MRLRVRNIRVSNLGPINNLDVKPGDITLIFGKNEKGKSFLVEFFINSIFKRRGNWGYLRDVGGGGYVILSIDGRDERFSPGRRRKLEDYGEILTSISPLFVVKSSKVEMKELPLDGVDRSILRSVFLHDNSMELIEKNIGETVKKSEIDENFEIKISRMGIGKEYREIFERLKRLKGKIKGIGEILEIGSLKKLEKRKSELKEKLKILDLSKRYRAYVLSEELKELGSKIDELKALNLEDIKGKIFLLKEIYEKVSSLKGEMSEIGEGMKKLKKLKMRREELIRAKRRRAYVLSCKRDEILRKLENLKDLDELKLKLSQYNRLKVEMDEEERKLSQIEGELDMLYLLRELEERYKELDSKKVSALPQLLFLLFFLSGAILEFLNFKILGSIFLFISLILFFLYRSFVFKEAKKIEKSGEISVLKEKYRKEMGKELISLSQISDEIRRLERKEGEAGALREILRDKEDNLRNLRGEISFLFKKICGKDLKEDLWVEELKSLEGERANLVESEKSVEIEIKSLNVSPLEYVREECEFDFSQKELDEVSGEVERLNFLHPQYEKYSSMLKKLLEEKKKLEDELLSILGGDVDIKIWEIRLKSLSSEMKRLYDEYHKKFGELKGLGIDESEYVVEDPGIKYSSEEYRKLVDELKEVTEEIEKKNSEIAKLKNSLLSEIEEVKFGRDYDVFEAIKEAVSYRDNLEKRLINVYSQIVADKIVFESISEIRKMENEIIENSLNSVFLSELVYAFTGGVYRGFSLEGENIFLKSDMGDFKLTDLSSGAREQVLMAIRIGLLNRVFEDGSYFLILDDPFVHTDWDRRELIIKKLVELSGDRVQIICFTMDNYTMELFVKNVEVSGKDFHIYEL